MVVDLEGYRFILDIKTDLKQIIREGIMQFYISITLLFSLQFLQMQFKGFFFWRWHNVSD